MAYSKARRLSDLITANAEQFITSAHITDTAITGTDIHSTFDLTGKTVTVATASAGDNDTSAASTAFVQQEIASLVDSAPGTLNTLNELAAALGDDANFSTTVTNSIATKLPLAGGTMTGTLTGVGVVTNGARNIIQRSNDDSSIAFANNASGTPSSHTWAIGLDYSASNGLAIAYSSSGIPSLTGNNLVAIDSSGRVGIGTGSTVNTNAHANADNFVIGNVSSRTGMTIVSDPAQSGAIHFSDGTSTGNANIAGQISYEHSDNSFRLYLNSTTEALRLTSSGGTVFNNSQNINQNFTVKASGNAAALMIDGNGGNVGIGTSNPNAPLHLETGTTTDILRFGAGGRWGFQRQNGDSRYMSLSRNMNTGSVNAVFGVDGDNGNVGIGTSSPGDKFEVLGSSTTYDIGADASAEVVAAFVPDSSNSRNGRLRIAGTTTPHNNSIALISDSSTNVGMSFVTTSGGTKNENMVITSAGNVGINTTTPLTKLQVVHTAWSSGAPYGSIVHIDGGSNHDNNWGHLHVNQSGTAANTGGRIRLGTVANNGFGGNPIAGITALNKDSSNGTYGNLEFSTRPSGGTNTMRMEISHNGHIKLSGDHGIRVFTGYFSAGTSTANFDVSGYGQGVMMMTAAFNHYGFIQNYGCYKRAICSNGPGHGGTSIEVNDVDSAITTSNGGSWTFHRQSGTQASYRITKNAGSYAGGGYYWVRFEGNMGV